MCPQRNFGYAIHVHVGMRASCSVMSDSLQPHGLWPARLLCPWNSPGRNTAVVCHSLLQRIFPTQGLNPRFPCCRQISLPSEPQGNIYTLNVCVYICLSISMQLCHYLCLSIWDLALWISSPCLCLLFLGLLSSLCPDFSDQLPRPVSSYSVSCLYEGSLMR